MPSQIFGRIRADAPASDSAAACAKCGHAMRIKLVSPVLFAGDFDDVTYACDDCAIEMKRNVKRM